MRSQQVDGFKVVVLNEVYYCLAFFFIESTAVNDDTFQTVVPYNIGVFSYHVEHKTLYLYHINVFFESYNLL